MKLTPDEVFDRLGDLGIADLEHYEDYERFAMTKREKQSLFMKLLPRLIDYIYEQGFECTGGDLYAISGHKTNSNHYSRLAIDINLFKDGVYLTDNEAHRPFAEYWKTLHPLCRAGIDFNDGNHYSLEHEGRK